MMPIGDESGEEVTASNWSLWGVSEEAQIKLGIGEHHPPLAKIRRSWGSPTFGAPIAPHDYLSGNCPAMEWIMPLESKKAARRNAPNR
jgi:hypothetical protein